MGNTILKTKLENIQTQMLKDNWVATSYFNLHDNAFGVIGESKDSKFITDYQTRTAENIGKLLREDTHTKPRKMLYVEGTPYDMGFITGVLFYKDIEQVCSVYMPHTIAQFISQPIDYYLRNYSLFGNILYGLILETFINIITEEVVIEFKKATQNNYIPNYLYDELKGIFDGVHSRSISTIVTIDKLICVNFALDYIMVQILSGRAHRILETKIKSICSNDTNPFAKQICEWIKTTSIQSVLTIPNMCTGFVNAEGFNMREFSFPDGNTFHTTAIHLIRKPINGTLQCGVTLPGVVGYINGINEHSLTVSITSAKSEAVDTSDLSLGSIAMIRYILDHATNVTTATELIHKTHRCCPWIYAITDDTGNSAVIETIASSIPSCSITDKYNDQISINEFKISNGMYARKNNDPKNTPELDNTLDNLTQQIQSQHNIQHLNIDTISTDVNLSMKHDQQLQNYYFLKWQDRNLPKGCMILGNIFMIPELRITQMGKYASLLGRNWLIANRYVTLAKKLQEYYQFSNQSDMSFDDAKTIIEFMNPHYSKTILPYHAVVRKPYTKLQFDYEYNYEPFKTDDEKNGIVIPGCINYMSAKNKLMETRFFTWGSKTTSTNLNLYS